MVRIGVLIIFYNQEKRFNKKLFVKLFKQAKDLKFCLVNNGSKDQTLNLLKTIKVTCPLNVVIVDIKTKKTNM